MDVCSMQAFMSLGSKKSLTVRVDTVTKKKRRLEMNFLGRTLTNCQIVNIVNKTRQRRNS